MNLSITKHTLLLLYSTKKPHSLYVDNNHIHIISWQISSNSKKRKISDDTSGPSKVRKLESSSVTSQEETYLSEEVIAEIASFLGPKNLWHVDTGIIPSIEHSTDELALIGSSEIVEA